MQTLLPESQLAHLISMSYDKVRTDFEAVHKEAQMLIEQGEGATVQEVRNDLIFILETLLELSLSVAMPDLRPAGPDMFSNVQRMLASLPSVPADQLPGGA